MKHFRNETYIIRYINCFATTFISCQLIQIYRMHSIDRDDFKCWLSEVKLRIKNNLGGQRLLEKITKFVLRYKLPLIGFKFYSFATNDHKPKLNSEMKCQLQLMQFILKTLFNAVAIHRIGEDKTFKLEIGSKLLKYLRLSKSKC